MGLPENLKELRTSHGLTQEEFGRIAGVTNAAVSTWESGEIALALIDDGATLKRFHQDGDTVILTPQSTGPTNQVQIYNLRDHTIRILGKAVETRKSF